MGLFSKSPEQYYAKAKKLEKDNFYGNLDKIAKYYLKAAQGGHIEAMYDLAHNSMIYKKVNLSQKEAQQWLMRAADSGHRDAQEALYWKYSYYHPATGEEAPQFSPEEEQKCIAWMKRDIAAGQHWAMFNYGFACLYPEFHGYDPEEGFAWLKRAAELDESGRAACRLSSVCEKGWQERRDGKFCLCTDKDSALLWMDVAVKKDKGNGSAAFELAQKYFDTDSYRALAYWDIFRQGKEYKDFPRKEETHCEWCSKFDKARPQILWDHKERILKEQVAAGDKEVLSQLAEMYILAGMREKGLAALQQGLEAGSAAAYMVAARIHAGDLVLARYQMETPWISRSIDQAMDFYALAVQAGYPGAAEAQQELLDRQQRFVDDVAAALRGDVFTMVKASECLTYGIGVDADLKSAFAFALQAAELDSAETLERQKQMESFLPKAKQGDLNCLEIIANIYTYNDCTLLDRAASDLLSRVLYSQYVMFCEQAAAQGDHAAEKRLYHYYADAKHRNYTLAQYWGDKAIQANYGPMLATAAMDDFVYNLSSRERREYAARAAAQGDHSADIQVKLLDLEAQKARAWEMQKQAILAAENYTPTASSAFDQMADKAERWGNYLRSSDITDLFFTNEQRYFRGEMSREDYLQRSWMRSYYEMLFETAGVLKDKK